MTESKTDRDNIALLSDCAQWFCPFFSLCVVLVCAYLTEFISEGETLHHALVHQRLFRRAVGDQLDALGLELTLSQNNRAHVCLFFNPLKWCEEAAFYSNVFALYLQV